MRVVEVTRRKHARRGMGGCEIQNRPEAVKVINCLIRRPRGRGEGAPYPGILWRKPLCGFGTSMHDCIT